jgi:signal transduction histidine kinase
MAIEKATHDTMSLLKKLIANTKDFVNKFNENRVSGDELKKFLIDIQESLEFLYQELQVLEPLLRVARKITKDVSVREVAGRVFKYFGRELKDGITATITSDNGNAGDVIVSTNTGLILQVILNLMDNSVYWLKQSNSSKKEIRLFLDSSSKRIIFADSGPGIDVDIIDLVFTEFYSKKVDGRGLGLYIVKELLDRIDAEISVITNPAEKVLE